LCGSSERERLRVVGERKRVCAELHDDERKEVMLLLGSLIRDGIYAEFDEGLSQKL
jgi:hypothetical protein